MSERANNGGPPPATDTAAPFGFTYGKSHTESVWSDVRHATWPQLVEMLTSHVPGDKEGSCIVPATFRGSSRAKDEATRIDVAFLDSDGGASLAEIQAALKARGWESVVSSTHSHMSTRTRVKLTNWDRFFAKHPDATPEAFLIEDKKYLPRVAQGATATETDGSNVFIDHQPCPKFRIALPLAKPWIAAEFPNQAAANSVWKERIEALAAALSLNHDQACTDTSRLFYLPRRPAKGVVPETAVISGRQCDIFALPSADGLQGTLLEAAARSSARTESVDTIGDYVDQDSGEVINLVEWAREFGVGFQIVKAIKARHPQALTGHISGSKVHIDCPNADAHTDPGRDGATFIVNGGAGDNKGFVVHCRHAHCTGKDRTFFVGRMLDEKWISIDDLTDKRFQPEQQATLVTSTKTNATQALPIKYWENIEANLDAADFVEGLLISEAMSVVYGQSNSGKTFFISDLALHVAAHMPWNGREVEPGAVLWLAMEGSHGIFNRIAAWRMHNNLAANAKVNIAVIPVALNLLDPSADIHRVIAAIGEVKAHLGIPVIWTVVDTLSRAIAGGNENSSEDMGALVINGTRIQQETKSHLTWIHHSGKDEAKGARGHSSLRAATDTEIEISAEGPRRIARVTKQREMECSGSMPFTLKVIELGINRRGKAVTSCVVVHSQDEPGSAGPLVTRLAGQTKRALEVLADVVAIHGKGGFSGTPSNVASVPEKWWRDHFYERAMPAEDQNTKQKAFRRAASELIEKKIVGMNSGRVWIAKSEFQPGQKTGQEPGHEA